MAKEKRVRYTVIGSYGFPIDMLRYDRAWPEREEDSALISATSNPRQRLNDVSRVRLVSLNLPTAGRWESFGWRVDAATIVQSTI